MVSLFTLTVNGHSAKGINTYINFTIYYEYLTLFVTIF